MNCSFCIAILTTLRLLVGTYTEGGASVGIYLLQFDQKNASYSVLDTARAGNPSFVAASARMEAAWSVEEFGDGRQGAVSFRLAGDRIDRTNARSTDTPTISGASPCNLLLAGGSLFTSNYSGGSLSAFPVMEDGSLGPLSAQFSPDGEGPSPHIHCAVLSPDGKYVFVTDLGRDKLYRFTLGTPDAPLQDVRTAWSFEDHKGPRHMTFNAAGDRAYLIHELSDEISVFSCADGALDLISTIPAYDGGGHGSADIHLSPNGRFLYASHRLKEDGISVFRVKRDGTLKPKGYCRTGVHPRNFAISPNGKFLLCACRDSGRIEIYRLNRLSGTLKSTGKSIELPAPTCVQFCD